MKIVQTALEWRSPQRITYEDNTVTNIAEAIDKYGRTNDKIELYDDSGNLVAIAVWPAGYKCYKYCTDPDRQFESSAWRYL